MAGPSTTGKRLRNYIGGEWVESDATSTHEVRNPATEELLAETPLCGASDIDGAVRSASQAFQSWRRVPPVERARFLFQLKFLLEDKAEELAQTVTRENGKTLAEALELIGPIHDGES